MKGWAGLALLALGVVLASAAGSRNGERHVQYRQATAEVAVAERAVAVVAASRALNAQLAKEGVDFSKLSMKEHLDLLEREPRLKAQVQAYEAAIAELKAWGLDPSPDQALHATERRRTAIGLPPPRERLEQWARVGGLGWLAGVLLIVAGALLARQQLAAEQRGDAPGASRADFEGAVREALARLDGIAADLADLPMDDDAPAIRERLDRLRAEVLDPLVDARAQLIARHGLAAFAEYFGPFSAGERNTNRIWSALTDGHAVVARESVDAARAGYRTALEAWSAVEARSRGAR